MAATIQHTGIHLSGFFEWSAEKLNTGGYLKHYTCESIYKRSEAYFDQKYYPNWLRAIYPEEFFCEKAGLSASSGLSSNQLQHTVMEEVVTVEIPVNTETGPEKKKFTIILNKLRVFLFVEGNAIFSIKVSLPPEHQNFSDISTITNFIRNTTDNPKHPINNPLADKINYCVIEPLGNTGVDWKKFNPQLKLFINIDVDKGFESAEQWDKLLVDLATVSPIGTAGSKGLYAFDTRFQDELLRDNTIQVFSNWKAICLLDATVRISVNLKEIDRNNLWEEEYYHIYIFISYLRYYLYSINHQLSLLQHNKEKARLRDKYFNLLKDVDMVQISYKFLPNIIYERLLHAMLVKEEMNRLENKLNRIDTMVREQQEARISKLLAFITICTIISVAKDATELILSVLGIDKSNITYNYDATFQVVSISFLVITIAGALAVYFYRGKISRNSR